MRIKFTEHVDIEDISQLPRTALGAIGLRHPKRSPVFSTAGEQTLKDKDGKPVTNADGEEVKIPLGVAEMKSEPPTSKHFFRKDWPAELPDDLARQYIAAGQAIEVPKVHRLNGDNDRLDGMYSQEDADLLLAGVILGYEKGSTAENPRYEHGPNWESWNAARLEVH